jgi:hypothetical protein
MLKCVECSATVDEHSADWRGYVAEPDEKDDGEFVLIYCPDCGAGVRALRSQEALSPPATAVKVCFVCWSGKT